MKFDTQSLSSKWGFQDGDQLDDLLYDAGIDLADSHTLLIAVVKQYIIPVLDQEVKVFTINTCHNPIRAESINGAEVDNYKLNSAPELTPVTVDVPDELILEIAQELNSEK